MEHWRRGKTQTMLSMLAAASVLGVGVPMGLGLPSPRPPRELTPQDMERIEAAKAKRARRAAKRRKP